MCFLLLAGRFFMVKKLKNDMIVLMICNKWCFFVGIFYEKEFACTLCALVGMVSISAMEKKLVPLSKVNFGECGSEKSVDSSIMTMKLQYNLIAKKLELSGSEDDPSRKVLLDHFMLGKYDATLRSFKPYKNRNKLLCFMYGETGEIQGPYSWPKHTTQETVIEDFKALFTCGDHYRRIIEIHESVFDSPHCHSMWQKMWKYSNHACMFAFTVFILKYFYDSLPSKV